MRIIPNLIRRHHTGEETKLNKKYSESHQRSWHVGSTFSTADSHTRRKSGVSTPRPPGGGRHNTWHFFHSRHSQHSLHEGQPSKKSAEQEKTGELKEEEEDVDRPADFVGAPKVGERKVFKQSANSAATAEDGIADDRRNKKDNWFRKLKRKTNRTFRTIEDFLFPGYTFHLTHHNAHDSRPQHVRGGVLLRSCLTVEEHRAKVQETIALAKDMSGEEGLRAVGFEYRFLPCPRHGDKPTDDNSNERICEPDDNHLRSKEPSFILKDCYGNTKMHILSAEADPGTMEDSEKFNAADDAEVEASEVYAASNKKCCPSGHICHLCSTQLFHIASDTRINQENRKLFIADGDMYDVVARLCQENAHEIMQRRYHLQWVTICSPDNEEEDHHLWKRNNHEAIRALVNPEHRLLAAENPKNIPEERLQYFSGRPTLLIITGKGKVRAGVFSRYYLFVGGMETSTAIPLIQEARLRELNVVVVDPNVHGDGLGMATFEKSMRVLFQFWESDSSNTFDSGMSPVPPTNRDLYILSHSASGSHLARYLMEKSVHYLPHIRAIAFTDSTHNIEWVRQRENHDLVKLLESPACVYFRCANENKGSNWQQQQAGEEAPRDQFWIHRFGNIRTYWAGTKEHALTNWYAHTHIWEHFDRALSHDYERNENDSNNES